MAKKTLISPQDYPLDRVLMGPEEFGRYNPQRHEFLQLTNILHHDRDANLLVGSREVGEEEWWCAGHLPGRPLLPGVLMVETLAQAGSMHVHLDAGNPPGSFLGFAGVDRVRFRRSVGPGEKLWVAGQITAFNESRNLFRWRGELLKEDGGLVCSGEIVGMMF